VRDPFSAQQRMFIEIVVEGLVQGTLTIGTGLDASLRAHRSPGLSLTICKERWTGAILRSSCANAGAATRQRTTARTLDPIVLGFVMTPSHDVGGQGRELCSDRCNTYNCNRRAASRYHAGNPPRLTRSTAHRAIARGVSCHSPRRISCGVS
jgi:hypothetical protein